MADLDEPGQDAQELVAPLPTARRAPRWSGRLIQRMLHLQPPATRDIVVQRNIQVPMPDGTVLLADRWAPRDADPALPTALIRTPYGRRGPTAAMAAPPLAGRGFQIVVRRPGT
ncbi:hypothetical protein ACWC09_44085 [Streptomyces sp. NPDC001617]